MNILLDPLPTTVVIDGAEFEINSDFRASIEFELAMSDKSLTDEERIVKAITLYYNELPEDIEAAIDAAIEFYQAEKTIEQIGRGTGKRQEQIYDYDYDADYIYAAFLTQYGIDLNTVPYLHWWKFKALFQALTEDQEIVKIMGYRVMTIDNNMTKEQKAFYKKMKEQYRIPVEKNERQKINAIEEALLNGENIEDIL